MRAKVTILRDVELLVMDASGVVNEEDYESGTEIEGDVEINQWDSGMVTVRADNGDQLMILREDVEVEPPLS